MSFGSIFMGLFGSKANELTIEEISELAIDGEAEYKEYGNNLVSKRGSVFDSKEYNFEEEADRVINTPFFSKNK